MVVPRYLFKSASILDFTSLTSKVSSNGLLSISVAVSEPSSVSMLCSSAPIAANTDIGAIETTIKIARNNASKRFNCLFITSSSKLKLF